MRNYIILFIFTLVSSGAFSQVMITDRPDQTESASTVPKFPLQLETGGSLEVIDKLKILVLPGSLFRYGIGNNIELRLTTSLRYRHLETDTANQSWFGLGNIDVGAKFRLINRKVQLAILTTFSIPSGTEGFTSKKAGADVRLALAHPIAKFLSIGYNVGYSYYGLGPGNLFYSASLGFSLTEKLGFFTEVYGTLADMEYNSLSYDNGLTYLIRENLQADFSFGTGINHRHNLISMGISWRIPD